MSSSRQQQGVAAAGGFVAAQAGAVQLAPRFCEDYPRIRPQDFAELARELAPGGEHLPTLPALVTTSELEACIAQRDQELAQARARVDELQQRLDSGRDEQLASLAAQLQEHAREQVGELAKGALRLALEAAERILRREIAGDPQTIERALSDLLWRLAEARDLRVRANPEDAAWLSQRPERLAELRVAEVVADRRIARGGCLVEAQERSWDASIDGQIEQLRAVIQRAVDEA